MPAPVGAYVMRNASVLIETIDYANQLTKAQLTPSADIQTLRTLVPDGIVQDVDSNVWTFALTLIQDNKTAQGLARFLTDAHGTQVDVDFTPKIGGVHYTFTAIAKAVDVGGEQGGFATAEVELPVIGQPTPVDPV